MSDEPSRHGDAERHDASDATREHPSTSSHEDTAPIPAVGPGAYGSAPAAPGSPGPGPAPYGGPGPYAAPGPYAGPYAGPGPYAAPGAYGAPHQHQSQQQQVGPAWSGAPVDTLAGPDPEQGSPRSRRTLAAVLASALLLGGLGGFAGAAGFEALDDDTSSAALDRTPLTTTAAEADEDTPARAGSPEAVAAEVLPSVVKINVVSAQGQGSGSGIVLSEDGEILTNNHVVEVATDGGEVTVEFNDGTSASATIVGTDPLSDLAVIQAEDVSGLTAATIGNSDRLDVGEGVVAIGSPFGLEATVTSGIVSSLNRPVSIADASGTDTTYPAIQTDAAINPGNSGGPLVDLDGDVVGINSSIRTSSSSAGEGGSIGLGFAIPITTVLPLVEQLRNGETPTHARLGVTVADTASSDGLITGARIGEVEPGSAGDEAGLEAGDIVTRIDDRPITSSEALVATVRGYRPGDTVTITVRRGGETQQLEAVLGSDAESSDS